MAATRGAQSSLRERLQKAQHALSEVATRRQGKPRLTQRLAGEEAITEILAHFRVEGLVRVQGQEPEQDRPERAHRGRLSGVRTALTSLISSQDDATSASQSMSR